MPEVVVSDAALDLMEEKSSGHQAVPGVLDAPVSVLSIIRPVGTLTTAPGTGRRYEFVWRIDLPDLMAGLTQALDLKAKRSSRDRRRAHGELALSMKIFYGLPRAFAQTVSFAWTWTRLPGTKYMGRP
jgi:hypothetical protein